MTDPPTPLGSALADRYRIERELGAGGMATVYLAHDLKHDRNVAVKVLRQQIAESLGAERFLREIGIAAQLQHPNILTLIDSGVAKSQASGVERAALLYYVMPYVQGESLRARLSREGKLPVDDTVRVLRDVLDALAYAHRQGIIHRDIKPENILFSGRHALVVDFGVAKAIAAGTSADVAAPGTLTTVGLAIGTPAYMAPEQATGQSAVDGRTDLYAVGVTAYEMLTGKAPFSAGSPQAMIAAHALRQPEPLSTQRPDLPHPLEAAIMRCLRKDPADRWPSAEALLHELEQFGTPTSSVAAVVPPARMRPRRWALPAAAAVLLAGVWAWTGPMHAARERDWAHQTAIPRLLALARDGNWESAYTLARQVEQRVPGDSLFNAVLPRFAQRYRIHTDPEGAEVWRKMYGAPDSAWLLLGRTPLESVMVPLSGPGGKYLDANRLRIKAPGYRTLDLIGMPFQDSVITLDPDSAIPPEMVRVGGGALVAQYPGFDAEEPTPLGDYLMDRFEVTNREYKVFVDSGGYRRPEFWTEPIVRNGRTIAWAEAMALMMDSTGRPGPSTWIAGAPPAGADDKPVSGVSWYEAMAYARFRGKSLPTVLHWSRAASVRNSAWIVPQSNFSSAGPVPVGSRDNVGAFGTYDMAGNVREWCLNATGSERYILGGGWADPPYRFNDAYAQDAFDRSELNGIRLVRYAPGEPNLARASAPHNRQLRDLSAAKPVGDLVFAAYRRQFDYDRTPLDARSLESVDEGEWTRELISVDAAYGGETLLLYLYLPKRAARPLPVVVFFPPGLAVVQPQPGAAARQFFDFLLTSGRAVLFPVYKGTFQRRDELKTDSPDSTSFYRDHVVMWGKDLRRSVDYLETRQDVTTDNLAYYGISWGGAMGAIMPAIEPRIKVVVLQVAGIHLEPARPEVDPVNYLPHITAPTLMINGRYDFYFPIETSQRPMFRLLGTPPGMKRHVIEDGSHFVPRVRLIQESLAWLDKYQPLGNASER